MWRSVGFLMSFAVVLEGMSIVTYIIILGGGKRLRENGWRILSILIVLSALIQAGGMSIVVSEHRIKISLRVNGVSPDMVRVIRHIYSIMKIGSLLAGNLISLGCSVLSAGALVFSVPVRSLSLLGSCLQRVVMN